MIGLHSDPLIKFNGLDFILLMCLSYTQAHLYPFPFIIASSSYTNSVKFHSCFQSKSSIWYSNHQYPTPLQFCCLVHEYCLIYGDCCFV